MNGNQVPMAPLRGRRRIDVPTFTECVGAILGVGALAVTAYAAIMGHDNQALSTINNLLLVAAGYFLRSKLAPPDDKKKSTNPQVGTGEE